MKTGKALELKLSELGLTSRTVRELAETIAWQEDSLRAQWDAEWRKELRETATIQDTINVIGFPEYKLRACERHLTKKLLELGLTKIDWVLLPNSSVTTGMLSALPKKKLLDFSVLLLGTLSSRALQIVTKNRKAHAKFTIKNLLQIDPTEKRWSGNDLAGNCRTSFLNTRAKLKAIGFRYEDGIFLQALTERHLIEDFMSQDSLSRRTASRFADIAVKRKWTKPFIE